MSKELNADWIEWININYKKGCDKDGIFKILLDEGFGLKNIIDNMGYIPTANPNFIINPLKDTAVVKENFKIQTQIQTDQANYSLVNNLQIHLPNAQNLSTDLAEFYVLDDFLNHEECKELTKITQSSMAPSRVGTTNLADLSNGFRTSMTSYLSALDNDFVKSINSRICSMIGINDSYSEGIQGQHYIVGQEFKAHYDYFNDKLYHLYAKTQGQRTYTFMVYLNDVEEGGETEFSRLNIKIKPQLGRAIIWNNLHPAGNPNTNTLHQSHPVVRGTKSIITKWFRSIGKGMVATKEPNELIDNYTKKGFKKTKLNKDLYARILSFYQDNQNISVKEVGDNEIINAFDPLSQASSMIQLPKDMRTEIHSHLLPQLSKWCGEALEPTFVYGIRTYHNGAILKPHRDRLNTHIISAIINIDQKINKPWPLHIEDNYYRPHEVFLQPGEMVFYEGARLIHGRPEALDGERFANIFCHYKPVK